MVDIERTLLLSQGLSLGGNGTFAQDCWATGYASDRRPNPEVRIWIS